MPPTVLFHPPQHTQPHNRTHTNRPEVNLTVSRKVSTVASDLLPPFLSPLFLLLLLCLCKWGMCSVPPSFLFILLPPYCWKHFLFLLHLSFTVCCFTSFPPSINLFIHLSTPQANTDNRHPPLSHFPYLLPPSSPEMRNYPFRFCPVFIQSSLTPIPY